MIRRSSSSTAMTMLQPYQSAATSRTPTFRRCTTNETPKQKHDNTIYSLAKLNHLSDALELLFFCRWLSVQNPTKI